MGGEGRWITSPPSWPPIGSRCSSSQIAIQKRNRRMSYALTMLAYLVPTFALGFVWHLILFARYYERLAMYRHDVIIPFGFLSMLIQAAIFAWFYDAVFVRRGGTVLGRAAAYAVAGAILSW